MNPSPSPSVPLPSPAPIRRRWWRGVLLFSAIAILTVIVLLSYVFISTNADWAAAEAEAAQDDPHWRLIEFEAQRPAIADAENSALLIIAVHAAGKGVAVRSVPNYDKVFAKLPPTAQLNPQQIQLIRSELAKIAQPLQQARLLKDMPRGRFPVKFTTDFVSTLLPDHQHTRNIEDWLTHDAWLLAQEEQIDQAVDSCQATVNAGRAMAGDPFLIALLVRIGLQNLSLTSLERVLAQGEGSDERLQAMQSLLERERQESGWLPAIRGERAGYHHLFENIRDSNVSMAGSFRLIGGGIRAPTILDSLIDWFLDHFPATILNYYPDFLRVMNQSVAIANLPMHEQEPKMQEWEKSVKTTHNPVIRMLAPAMQKVHQAEYRSQAMLRSAIVALACERYRLKHHDWPTSLDVLVKDKWLAALPTDPMDNQPLRYRRHADGIVVYSIGIDKIDNLGHIDRNGQQHLPGLDIGFRLWNIDKRRQSSLPPVANQP